MYFDLEFSKDLNPNANGARMVDTFIKVRIHIIRAQSNLSTNKSLFLNRHLTVKERDVKCLDYTEKIIFQR